MGQPSGCSTPASKSSALKQWIEKNSLKRRSKLCVSPHSPYYLQKSLLSIFDYGSIIYDYCCEGGKQMIEKTQISEIYF